jgi:methionyl-tRNA synthetase
MKPTRRIYFRLSAFTERLRAYLETVEMNVHLRALCERMLSEGLPDISATHFTEWGVPVPVPGFEEQRIYVWFEMAAGYLAATEELSDPRFYDEVWKRGGRGQVVQFFGFDNGWFHTLLFPAIFFAFDERLAPPQTFVMNEFYRLDGSKFSTSRNHAVWGQEFLSRFSADAVRYYLAFDGPEREQSSFNLECFEQTIAEELGGRWQGWLDALDARLERRHQRLAPEPGGFTREQDLFYCEVARLSSEVRAAYDASTFSLARAARTLSELVRTARRFGESEEHWVGLRGRERHARTSIALELMAARALALAAVPLLPELGERLLVALGEARDTPAEDAPAFLPAGRAIGDLRAIVRTTA